jgi:hypothetical protein
VTIWAFTGSVVLAIAAYVLLSGFFSTWRKYRGLRVITCPENLDSASVRVDALRAAHWAAISGDTVLRLSNCSRWPEMAGCGQECLAQIQSSPEGCAVSTIVTAWYEGRTCVYCKRPIGPIAWHERPPAVRSADGVTREWKDIPAEQLPAVFRTHQPVCFNCSVTEGFLHDHPDIVVARGRGAERHATLVPSNGVY